MMPELIIGIDPSLRSTGVCLLQDDGTFSTEAVKTTEKIINPKVFIWDHFTALFIQASHTNKSIFASIEQYPFGMTGSKSAYGIEIGAIIRLALEKNGIPYIVVSPNTWKSSMLKPGWFGMKKGTKAKDAAYLTHVTESTGLYFDTTDEADAYCMAQYARKERMKNGD